MRKRRLVKSIKSAPLWKRTFAYIVDIIVINAIIILPFKSFLESESFTTKNSLSELALLFYNNTSNFYNLILVSVIIAILSILYWALLEYFAKQSVGKILFRLKVISTEGPLKFSQTLIRNITKLSIILLIIDSIYLFGSKGLRFLDRLAETRVVEV